MFVKRLQKEVGKIESMVDTPVHFPSTTCFTIPE